MALMKCVECGHDVSDKAEACANCGCPVSVTIQALETRKKEEEQMQTQKKLEAEAASAERKARLQKNKTRIVIISILAVVLLAGGIVAALTLTKDSRTYQAGIQAVENKNYAQAIELFSQIPEYEDAKALLDESKHLLAVENDTTPPAMKGIEPGAVLEAEYESYFNVQDFLNDNLRIYDEVSGTIPDFRITTSAENCDRETWTLDTERGGTSAFTVTAADEAGNEASIDFSVFVDDTIYINGDDEFPKVIYQGKYGTITFDSIEESKPYSNLGYCFYAKLSFENGFEHRLQTWIRSPYFNGIKVNMYHPLRNYIEPGKRGSTYSYVDEKELTAEMKPFDYFEGSFQIADEDDTVIFERPIRISADAIQNYNPK